ncbi:MAG: polysaccharide biosynthesis tyrosine autokinase [Nitrospirae bacterium]|nr:MAG: polysaccharide biosynthesis tyrosine autokinase [Nitrospirota bacterium]
MAYMNGQNQNMEEQEVHLRDYLRVISKRRQTVYTFFAVVFVLVLIGTFSMTPMYKASTKLLLEKSDTRPLTNVYQGYDPEFYATQYQLIKSSSVARNVVDMLGLDKRYDPYLNVDPKNRSLTSRIIGFIPGLVSSMFRTKKLEELKTEPDPDELADRIAKRLSANIIVSPVKNSKIVDISFISPNPELSRTVANSIAKAYIGELLDLHMSSTKYTIEWMSKKAEEERLNVEKAEKTLQEYQKNQNFVMLENRVTIIPQKIAELNSKLISAESKKRELESLYNKVKEVSSKPGEAENLNVIASDPTLQTLRQQIIKSEQDVTELAQKFGQKHPTLMRAREDLASLKQRRDQEIRRVIESVKNDYDLARSNEASLRRLLSEAKGEAMSINEKAMEYGIINREVETNRQLYDALIKKVKEQSITEQTQSVNVLIVEKAELPTAPVKPRKALNLLLGLIVGLFGGIGMAFFVEYLDHTVKSPDDAEAKTGATVLGLVPLMDVKEKPIETIVIKEPNSVIAESYKAIRTAILLSTAEKPPKRILVTSTSPEEGKTSTSINIASAIAQAGYSVLLLEADLRRPRISKVFGLSNAKGLSTFLTSTTVLEEVIHQDVAPHLSILTAGPIPPNPSELLGSKRMKKLIEHLGEQYDFIICDSPPLLSVADSLMLDKVLDATIIVTRAGKTTYDAVRKGLRQLTDMKSHVLGIIINALDVKKSDYYYYRYYNYYYSAKDSSKDSAKKKPKKKA